MRTRMWWLAGAAAALVLSNRLPATANPPGSPAALESRALCARAESETGEARERTLEEGVRRAESAIADDDADAAAHLALFCNLGKQMQDAGWNPLNLFKIDRMQREIDRAHELAPEDADVLAAKGAFLVRLPGFLGGDEREGQRLLRGALAREPDNEVALRYLAR